MTAKTTDSDRLYAGANARIGMGLLYGDAMAGARAAVDFGSAAYAEAWSDKERELAIDVGKYGKLLRDALAELDAMRNGHPVRV